MRLLDLTLPMMAENLALDEALLLAAESGQGGELLRLWEWPSHAVVLGAGCRLAEEVNEAACAADSVPILRRSSGGGTVLLGAGCLLYSLILRYERDPALAEIRPSYRYILDRTGAALAEGIGHIEQAGVSDLILDGRKFSGTSQQRKRNHLLHHGTLLYSFHLDLLSRYLPPPPRQPEYRAGRSHAEFVRNLPLTGGEIRRRMRAAWGAERIADSWPLDRTAELAKNKYVSIDWTRRR
jgi:lipoate-protein ligase A